METLKLRIEIAQKALQTLKAIMEEPYSVIVRDAAIQRFEYTSEIFWKVIKGILTSMMELFVIIPNHVSKKLLK